MPELRIGKSIVGVEGIKALKQGVQLDDKLKNQLQKDGLDEIIFQKGDQLFVAYKKNLDLSKVQLNLTKFDEDSAYDAGQLSMDGEAVKVLFVDNENKESFWAAPYKSTARGVVDLTDDPVGKGVILSFVAGAATSLAGKAVPGLITSDAYGSSTYTKAMKGVIIGTATGTVAAGLKAGQEMTDTKDSWDTGIALLANTLSYGAGIGAGIGGYELGKLAAKNPKVTALTVGITAAVVGTGIILDAVSNNNKTTTYKVINKISK